MPEIAGLGIASVFLAGLVSFLSPCVLPLVPGYVSYIGGRSLDQVSAGMSMIDRAAVFGQAMMFVLGFSMVFMVLGASATGLGQLLLAYRYEANIIAGIVVVIFGLHMMGVFRWGPLDRDWRFAGAMSGGTPTGAFLLGTAFAFGWTPCIGPILGAILAIGATSVGVREGVALLGIYSMGLAVPFLLVAAFTGPFMARMGTFKRISQPLRMAAGGILVIVGVAMLSGRLTWFGTWLLNTFPFFQTLVL